MPLDFAKHGYKETSGPRREGSREEFDVPEIVQFSSGGLQTRKALDRDRKTGSQNSWAPVNGHGNPMSPKLLPLLGNASNFGATRSFLGASVAQKADSLEIGPYSLAEMAAWLL